MTRLTISYDVFDTVVTRAFAHPRDLFVHLGDVLEQRGLLASDAMTFATARWAAELTTHKSSPENSVVLDDIYRVLATRLGWAPATTEEIKALELEIESRHLQAVPRLQTRLAADRTKTGRLLFLSDMYLPAAVLRPWLEREGVIKLPEDVLLISGEAGGNKSSGALFAVAQQQTGADFAQWHHTGDHPFADFAKPRQLGLQATLFTDVHLTPREQTARGTTGEFAPVWRSFLAGAMRLARLDGIPASARETILWDTGTGVAGPLFYAFVRWTLTEAERRGLKRLYFLARDGQIFWKIAQEFQRAVPGSIEYIYLHASRLVFSGPAELASAETLRWLAAPTGHFHSLRQTLLQLGLDESWANRALPAEFLSAGLDANLSQTTRDALADWLLAPNRRLTLEAAIEARSVQARAYLHSVGLRAGEPVGLVDTGWLGSIQRNLESIIGSKGKPAPLTGFYLGLMPAQSPLSAGELVGFTNLHAPLPLLRDESHKVLVELMTQSDHGQVIGFEPRDGSWRPVLNDAGPVNLDEVRFFHTAILAFTRQHLKTAHTTVVPNDEFARAAIGLYRDFHDHPSAPEVEVFGFLPHADQLFEQKHATLCARLSWTQIIAALLDYRKRPPHWWVEGQAALGSSIVLHAFKMAKQGYWRLRGRKE